MDAHTKKEVEPEEMDQIVFCGLVVGLGSVMFYRHYFGPLTDKHRRILAMYDDL